MGSKIQKSLTRKNIKIILLAVMTLNQYVLMIPLLTLLNNTITVMKTMKILKTLLNIAFVTMLMLITMLK